MGASERRASTTAVAAVVGGALLLVLLVGWASSTGPSGILTGDGPARITDRPTPTTSTSPPPRGPEEDPAEKLEREAPRLEWLKYVAYAFEALLAAAAAYLIWRGSRWAWQTWQARRRPDPESPDVEFDVLADTGLVAEELARRAPEQRGILLGGGTPRNAVVQAWAHFETTAERIGASRHRWETSSEFTLRLLEAVDADARAVARLAALYREARFSEHELTEAHRAAALEALDAVHASLPVRSTT